MGLGGVFSHPSGITRCLALLFWKICRWILGVKEPAVFPYERKGMTLVSMFVGGVWSEPGLFNPLTHLSDLQQLVLLCVLGFSNLSQGTISVYRERFPDHPCSCPTTFFRVQLKSEHDLDLAPRKGCFSRGGRIHRSLVSAALFLHEVAHELYMHMFYTYSHIELRKFFSFIPQGKRRVSFLVFGSETKKVLITSSGYYCA